MKKKSQFKISQIKFAQAFAVFLVTFLIGHQFQKIQILESKLLEQEQPVSDDGMDKNEGVYTYVNDEWRKAADAKLNSNPDYWVTYKDTNQDFLFEFPNSFYMNPAQNKHLIIHGRLGGGMNTEIIINGLDNKYITDFETYIGDYYDDDYEMYVNQVLDDAIDLSDLNPGVKQVWLVDVLGSAASINSLLIMDQNNRIFEIQCVTECSLADMKHMAESFQSPIQDSF